MSDILQHYFGLYSFFSLHNLMWNLILQVSLPVVRRFIESVSEKAIGTDVIRGVRPDQQLVKVYPIVIIYHSSIVHAVPLFDFCLLSHLLISWLPKSLSFSFLGLADKLMDMIYLHRSNLIHEIWCLIST